MKIKSLLGACLALIPALTFALNVGDHVIVDNTDSGFTFTPTAAWTDSTMVGGYYGINYKGDITSGADTGVAAKWTPGITDAGLYKIYMRWTAQANRPAAAPVEIRYANGTKTDNSLTVNQRVNGGQWVFLGTYFLGTSGGDYVKISGADAGYTCADAVMFQLSAKMPTAPVEWTPVTPASPPTPDPLGTEVVVDNLDSGFSTYINGAASAWSTSSSTSGYHGTNYALNNTNGNWNYALFEPNLGTPGRYEVSLRWTAHSNRADAASVVVIHKHGVDSSKTVNMTTAGGQWNLLGEYDLMGGSRDSVSLVCDDSGYVIADAVKFKLIAYESTDSSTPTYTGARAVNLVRTANADAFMLKVDGSEFYTNGVCGVEVVGALGGTGANALRTYDGSSKHLTWDTLDQAYEQGLMVMIGLWIQHDGVYDFDNDEAKVQANLDQLKTYVDKFKDHPAVLAWGVGNEVDKTTSPASVYRAINHLAKYIKSVDKNHPTIAVLAGSSPIKVTNIRTLAPDIDIVAVNTYKHIGNAYANIVGAANGNWVGPYMVTEYGCNQSTPTLTESPKTTWGATLELPSHEKSMQYRDRYEEHILLHESRCIGSFVFKGADVVGVTHTWYNMYLENDYSVTTGIHDAMVAAWTGTYPSDRAPGIKTLTYNGQYDHQNVTLSPNTDYMARITIDKYGETDVLTYVWEIRDEYRKYATGYPSNVVPTVQGPNPSFTWDHERRSVRTPSVPGYYRLFAYVYDANGHVGTASLPFLVN